MLYTYLANCVLFIHLLFIVFVLAGGLCILLRRWVAWVHIPAAAWGMLIEFFGWQCPLTPLEHWLRALSGQGTYSVGFIENILLRIIYPIGLTRELQIFFGLFVLMINCCIYWYVFTREKKKPEIRKEPDREKGTCS